MPIFFPALLLVIFSSKILYAADSNETPQAVPLSSDADTDSQDPLVMVSDKASPVPMAVPEFLENREDVNGRLPKEKAPSVKVKVQGKTKKSAGARASAKSSLYRFADHLSSAEVELFNQNKEPEVLGVWANDAVFFRGYEKEGSIQKTHFNIEEVEYEAISAKMVAGRSYLLKFRNVSPGAHLVVRYVLSPPPGTRDAIFSYLRVLVGQDELKRVQVSSKDPWMKQEMDLGIISFLNRGVTVAFELTPERVKGLTFSIVAEMRN